MFKKIFCTILSVSMFLSIFSGCSHLDRNTKDTEADDDIGENVSSSNDEDENKNIILQIPKVGQTYYKNEIYTGTTEIRAVFHNGYISINEIVNGTYKSVLFDKSGQLIYDGIKNNNVVSGIIDNKILVSDLEKFVNGSLELENIITFVDLITGEEISFFDGYTPQDYSNGYWSVTDSNNKYGIIDKKGNTIIPCQYDAITTFDDKGGVIVCSNEKMGMVDKENRLLIPINYDVIVPFNKGVTNDSLNRLYGCYPETYDYTLCAYENYDSGTNIKTIDRNGNEVFDLYNSEYEIGDSLSKLTLSQNLISVKNNDLYGFIDMQGNEVIPLQYNGIGCDFVNGYAVMKIGENYGVINTKNETVLPFQYYRISAFDQKGFAIAKLNEKDNNNCVIDLAGNIVYQTENELTALGGGFFKEIGSELISHGNKVELTKNNTSVFLLTTNKDEYITYKPEIYTKKEAYSSDEGLVFYSYNDSYSLSTANTIELAIKECQADIVAKNTNKYDGNSTYTDVNGNIKTLPNASNNSDMITVADVAGAINCNDAFKIVVYNNVEYTLYWDKDADRAVFLDEKGTNLETQEIYTSNNIVEISKNGFPDETIRIVDL